ncbi:hypothetical protein [Spirosoma foliorum]|uniref:Nucleotidyltransferase n=1 Tax=Spirosoma foliorum TaxID=2710596 RepID=A0A7G5GX62_9BACT|nr:hypothetical protein [Spirosoma foliorum]QMW03454.1 hypothetical protein H3H32_00330 [Spirosoma foliorum]
MEYNRAILDIFAIFNSSSVNYLIVGGTAVAYYGYSRKSTNNAGKATNKPDLDFWYNPSYENYFKLLNALEQLGKDVTEYREDPSPDPKNSFFRLEFDDYTLDLLPRIKAPLKFNASFAKKNISQYEDIEIPFISLEDLIQDKETFPRQKDINDIEHLRKF